MLSTPQDRWPKLEARLRARTRMLVRRHRERIERVAAALMDRKTLSGDELDPVGGRFVQKPKNNFIDEVKRFA